MNIMAIMIFLMLGFIIAAVLMCYYIYSLVLIDAKSRGIKNPKFWSLIAAGGQRGEGLLLYLFSRRKTTSSMSSAEIEQVNGLKRKIYCVMAVFFFLFLLAVLLIFQFA